VLIPRPETELVAERAIEVARQVRGAEPLLCADLGTGSGAIGLSLLHELPRGSATVWLTDLSLDALDVARANGAGLGMAGTGARYTHGSWFEALPTELRGGLDVVVSNPPYIAEGDARVDDSVRAWEPHGALYSGVDGLDDIRTLALGASEWLRPGGWLVLEIGAGQGAAVSDILNAAGLVEVSVLADIAGHDRVASARRMKSS
jgi:release factor glutamine methyltransferase